MLSRGVRRLPPAARPKQDFNLDAGAGEHVDERIETEELDPADGSIADSTASSLLLEVDAAPLTDKAKETYRALLAGRAATLASP